MGGHQGGPTSKLSIDLCDVNRQLRSGKTRKGKDLIEVSGGRAKLEVQKQIILSTMKETQNNRRQIILSTVVVVAGAAIS